MKRKPSRDLKIIFVEPEGGCDPERLSTAPSRPISEKGGIGSVSHKYPEHRSSNQDTLSSNQQKPLDSNPQPDGLSLPDSDPSAFLTNEEVQKFQELYKSRFGKDISYEEACEKGVKLVRLMELVYRPMTQEEYQTLQKRRKNTEGFSK
jgi:hypothetical protein